MPSGSWANDLETWLPSGEQKEQRTWEMREDVNMERE